jgi:hypothetical protein
MLVRTIYFKNGTTIKVEAIVADSINEAISSGDIKYFSSSCYFDLTKIIAIY